MTTATLEQLQQLFADASGLRISQFGDAPQPVAGVSTEIVALDQNRHTLDNILFKFTDALQTYTPEADASAAKSWVKRHYAASKIIQRNIIWLRQNIDTAIAQVKHLSLMLNYQLEQIEAIKQQHHDEIKRLQEAISQAKALLQLTDAPASQYNPELLQRFSRKIISLEQELLIQRMAILQIDNSLPATQISLQQADRFLSTLAPPWKLRIDQQGGRYHPAQLLHLDTDIIKRTNDGKSGTVIAASIGVIIIVGIAGVIALFIGGVLAQIPFIGKLIWFLMALGTFLYVIGCLFTIGYAFTVVCIVNPQVPRLKAQLMQAGK